MMFINVDLPDPGRAHDRDELAALHDEVDAAERLDMDGRPSGTSSSLVGAG